MRNVYDPTRLAVPSLIGLTALFQIGALHAQAPTAAATRTSLVRMIDINRGETQDVELCNGGTATVKLIDLKETRDSIRSAVRRADVTVEVNGRRGQLVSASYHVPVTIGDVQVDCPITHGNYSNADLDSWGLVKEVRLRLWPADSPLIEPGTFGYPLKQRWFASNTWTANQAVDGIVQPGPQKVTYHAGEDIGGAEGLVEVVAATDGLIVSSGLDVLKGHKRTTEHYSPVEERYDVIYLLDKRGWYYRYSHLKEIDPRIVPGRTIQKGDRLGVLGKEGASGGWSHLHFEIKSPQPSGKWGTQPAHVFLWEAYRNQYKPKIQAVARQRHLLLNGDEATLDGSLSWSATGKIVKYEWQFCDGSTAEGARVHRKYPRAGSFSEILKVTDAAGHVDYDFANVKVLDRGQLGAPQGIYMHAAYAPTFRIRPGDPVTFKVRTFGTTHGHETWDFGDGSPKVEVHSLGFDRKQGNLNKLAKDGYAVTVHRYEKPGHYLVNVQRENAEGQKALARLHVRVGDDN